MIIRDTNQLRYDTTHNDHFIKPAIPEKSEPVYDKKKLERIAEENPNDPYIQEYLSKAVYIDISDEGKLLSEKDSVLHGEYKQSGVTSQREAWETESAARKNSRYDLAGNHSIDYMMQLDEPDTVAAMKEIRGKAMAAMKVTKDGLTTYNFDNSASKKYMAEYFSLINDWEQRRCRSTGSYVDPAAHTAKIIDNLEKKYSGKHDLSINVYGKEGSDEKDGIKNQFSGSSIWRYSTKFNLLMNKNMLGTLTKGIKSEQDKIYKQIDDVMNELKDIEKRYEGDKVFLRFGAKFHNDGSVTYHANYGGCKNAYGIEANSADELLEMLMSDS